MKFKIIRTGYTVTNRETGEILSPEYLSKSECDAWVRNYLKKGLK